MGSPFATALEELRNRREHHAAEVKKLERLIRDLENLPPSITGSPTTAPPVTGLSVHLNEQMSISDVERPIVIRPNELEHMAYGAAAAIVVRRAGRPLGTLEILVMMASGGRPVQGNDPYRTLYRTLMKSPTFKNVGKKWALVERAEIEDLLQAK